MVDDPKLYRGHGSVPFDGEGLPTTKRNVIEKGILKVYKIYQDKILGLNVCDFGDLILHCVSIFENKREYYFPCRVGRVVLNFSALVKFVF